MVRRFTNNRRLHNNVRVFPSGFGCKKQFEEFLGFLSLGESPKQISLCL
ncbi:hypothetical protein LEP1GSC199_0226 [Leptospira vanthielii serovar Holland str. Waz Holland = ATCC 700522]|uniref:Uncharacterized protein n=1 Tax=Leptospira vanthielii serovar Holland str. Waz Holland = ATCC 700522 TaxID=1218591 RepID=N1WCW1_9LEPT|nr:hypothetical protein LEP1GSC199_0226 [Leptospira vanthielii serovar Holland str. Waz Holland = ATCC 700522]